jgi:hypothetical protein
MRYNGGLTPEELDEEIVRSLDGVRESAGSMPVFGVVGWTGAVSLGEWIYEGGPHSLLHGEPEGHGTSVQVQTTAGRARDAVFQLRREFDGPWEGDQYTARFDAYDVPPDRIVEVLVDATPVQFDVWSVGDVTWAAGSLGRFGLALEARSYPVDDLALEAVTDLEPYIAGRLAWLRRFEP